MMRTQIRSRMKRAALALFGAAVLAAPVAGAALAQSYADRVTAQSRYGNGSATAPVRINDRGYPEVRLPGGFWADCAGDCRETLRRMHLDFWETMEEESGNGDRR